MAVRAFNVETATVVDSVRGKVLPGKVYQPVPSQASASQERDLPRPRRRRSGSSGGEACWMRSSPPAPRPKGHLWRRALLRLCRYTPLLLLLLLLATAIGCCWHWLLLSRLPMGPAGPFPVLEGTRFESPVPRAPHRLSRARPRDEANGNHPSTTRVCNPHPTPSEDPSNAETPRRCFRR